MSTPNPSPDSSAIDPDSILKAVAHPMRREMLNWLKAPEQHFADQQHPLSLGVCASMFERCGLSQSTVSTHLSILQRAGLVTARRVGQWVFYQRDEAVIAAFLAQLGRDL